MSDASDEEAEAADEERDYVRSIASVPRSDADHLMLLDGLGINAADQVDVAEDLDQDEPAKRQRIGESEQHSYRNVAIPIENASNEMNDVPSESSNLGLLNHVHEGPYVDASGMAGLEDEERLEELEMRSVTHPCHESFAHHVVWPAFVHDPNLPLEPNLDSWTFQHQLDPVQLRAIACVENHGSVLLSAPTSAGKTAVATYAVAMALRCKRRAIYTTPIKALSNQKFLELGKTFGGEFIGMLTGDTVIASDAPIVVMTLEILQSMLYKQAREPQLLDDFQCVVIDEAHFLGHVERGHAWEEALILLPPHLQLILLSATIPNAADIADWCARIRMQPIHVITTDKRPAP